MIRIFFSFSSMGLEKNSIGTRLSPKKNYFCFWLQYHYGAWELEKNYLIQPPTEIFFFWLQFYYVAWDLEKTQSVIVPRWKKNIFVSGKQYDYGVWNLENIQSAIDTGSKKLFSFLSSSTTWTWCMGLGLTQSVLELHY